MSYVDEYFNNFKIDRSFMIQKLIDINGYQSYLEIGVNDGCVFNKIKCAFKASVDPIQLGATTYQMTSDDFFRKYDELNVPQKFDIIFIDGLHLWEQCYRDICNAIKRLNPNGIILLHDMNPINPSFATRNPVKIADYDEFWNGDVYKAFIKFRANHLDWSSCLIYDCDFGLGVIKKGIGQKITIPDIECITFEYFTAHKEYLMNCISTNQFMSIIDNI